MGIGNTFFPVPALVFHLLWTYLPGLTYKRM